MKIKNHFHISGFAFSLALKQRLGENGNDLCNASDWREQSFNQSEAFPSSWKWHVISMEFLRSFLRCHFAGKLEVAPRIGHFRVPKSFTFKTRLSTKPLLWKWVLIMMQIKLISATKVSLLASFWKWNFLELGNGLLLALFSNYLWARTFFFC